MNEIKIIKLSDFVKKARNEELNYNGEAYLIEDEYVFQEVEKVFTKECKFSHMYNFILGVWFTIYNCDINTIDYDSFDNFKLFLNLNELKGCYKIIKDKE